MSETQGSWLVRVALAVLRRRGRADQTPEGWERDLCRCLHARRGHYPECDRCGTCRRFRIKARQS